MRTVVKLLYFDDFLDILLIYLAFFGNCCCHDCNVLALTNAVTAKKNSRWPRMVRSGVHDASAI